MRGNKKASLGFIFITVLIDLIGIGMIIPVAPSLIQELTGRAVDDIAIHYMVMLLAYSIPLFFFAPILGALSDRYGRRPLLLISVAGLSLDYVMHAVAPTFTWLIIGRIFGGICGASHTVATAYVSDISTHENKAKNFGLIGAAFGLGFIIGPFIGGVVSEEFGIRAPFILAAILGGLNFLYGLFVIPESLDKSKRRELEWSNLNPINSILHLKKYKTILGLIIAFFLLQIAGQSLPSTWALFSEYRFGWSEAEVGYSLSFVGLLVVLVQGGLTGFFVKKFGNSKAIIIGYTLWCLGMTLFAFASEGWMLFVFSIPYCLGGIAGPTLQGVVSNQVPDEEQGELQGSLTALISLSSILGFLIYNPTLEVFTGPGAPIEFPGAPYIVAAVFLILAFYITYRFIKHKPQLFETVEAPAPSTND